MQIRILSSISVLFLGVILQGCDVKTHLPLKGEDIQLCAAPDKTVAVVNKIADAQNLSFHYGTHPSEYGTQITFRLIGAGFEVELFNSMRQSDYTLRAYQMDAGAEQATAQAFQRFRDAVKAQLGGSCDEPPRK